MVEFETVISPGLFVMLPQARSLTFSPTLAGRTATLQVSHRTVHVVLDGQLIRTRSMTFTDADLRGLVMRGRPLGGPELSPMVASTAAPVDAGRGECSGQRTEWVLRCPRPDGSLRRAAAGADVSCGRRSGLTVRGRAAIQGDRRMDPDSQCP